ncbi:MAG TPA: helix-turn-helix transcriptional regulator [Candidatus Sulfotelmatobacter sp.]|nr:helix-turn-helix transcriptional regulator [Candidatus Sulfotelmatobacter sp.]
MARRKRPELVAQSRRLNLEQLARLGGTVAESRRRRRWSQATLAGLVGLSQSAISLVELGGGGTLSLDAWQRIGLALDRPLRIELSRDVREEPADAGHLAIQELVVRTARRAGWTARFELPSRPSNPTLSTDVGLRDDAHRRLALVECWNTFGDLGAAARSTNRKVADANGLAAAIGGGRPADRDHLDEPGPTYEVGTAWIVRATRRNRELLARYPELFASRFPGSSVGWLRTLTTGAPMPTEPGLVWCDVAATRLYAWRRR